MKLARPLVALMGFLFVFALIASPTYTRGDFAFRRQDNSPPVAVSDNYTVHGQLTMTPMENDFDPDGDPIFGNGIVTQPQNGTLQPYNPGVFTYTPFQDYTGSDSFTYSICDGFGACSDGTVNLDVVNQSPTAQTDNYTVHGQLSMTPIENDSDPDGDFIIGSGIVTQPQHGTLLPYNQNLFTYTVSGSYTGADSFSYRICDSIGACSIGTVNLDVVNHAPVAMDDLYVARGVLIVPGPDALRANDSDADGDNFHVAQYSWGARGTVSYSPVYGSLTYQPSETFFGTDSFTYTICDDLGLCSTATATVLEIGDGEDDGDCGCNRGVGEPVNVTNGNVYLRQRDHSLPSTGPALDVTRAYNSDSPRIGLFGRGWSTAYDESIVTYDSSLVRLNEADGRATYFGHTVGSSGAFTPLEGDFHGQLTQSGGFTLSLKDGSVSQFDATGKLLSMTDRNGNQTALSYDANGRLASIMDPFGRVLTITTNANGQVLSIGDTLGTIASYSYGAGNELLSVTYADNSQFQFSYDGNYRLTTVTDALGHIVESHTYDGQGRALTSERQGGAQHYALSYVSDAETDVTDALGHLTKYTFDQSKGRNVVTSVEGLCSCGGSQVQTWTYDNQLNVTSKTDALGHSMAYTYDGNGNRLTETDSTGTVTSTYNQFSEILTRTDQLNGLTTNTYDTQGDLLTTTNALNNTTTFTYDTRGQLLTVTDARGKMTSFAYDASGNLITETNALGHATQFVYDGRARLTSVTNALGHVTAFAYDAVGRLRQVTQADGTFITYEFDLGGRQTAMTDASGNRTTYAYDGANRATSETDALSQSTSYSYDPMSNLTAGTDALSRVTNYDYDDFNRLVKITYPSATTGATRLFETLAYDADGNVTQRTDTAGRVTSNAYDNVNRVVSTTDAGNKTTSFEYDGLSRMTALVDALSQRYRFNYDGLGQLRHIRRGATVMSFTYDAVGNRKERTDYNGASTTYDYDALNRLKTISYPDSTTVTYSYDKLSRLKTATNENGSIALDYNKMNRLTSVTDVFGQVVDYNYDGNGNRTKLSLNAATVATYRYDAVNRLTKIIDSAGAATNYSYDTTNKLISRRLPNAILTSYQYDGLDRLTRLRDAKGVTTVADHQYQYDAASQITQIAEPNNTRSYGHDAVDRLTSAAYTNPAQPNENYAYDGVGNRSSSHLSSSYGYQPFNRLVSTSAASFVYDTNGNLISKTDSSGTTQYSWDFENRLKQVTLPNGNTVSYKYDALGRRIQRIPTIGISTNFIYDGQDVLKDLNSDGSTVDYLNGPGIDNKLRLTDSRLTALGPVYFLQDQLGSTTALTNSLGVSVSQVTYDAFGNSSGSSLTRYDYTGRERDPDTAMLYYRVRFYDPQVGRFVSEDPAGLIAGINPYTYVENDPIQWADPSGLCRCGIKRGPEYYTNSAWHSGGVNIGGRSIPGGTKFHWYAEFLNDATHDPKCCEVRQLISWNRGPFGPNTAPHEGFPSWARPGQWLEDRNKYNRRYGRRTGPYADPSLNDINGNEYHSDDQPNGTGTVPGFALRFRLIVVDVCQGGKRIYTSKTITVSF